MRIQRLRLCTAVIAVSVSLAMNGTAHATTTLRAITATTNYGRTCTIVFQGGSPYQVVPALSSRMDFGGSISCTGGAMYSVTTNGSIALPGGVEDPVGFAGFMVANQVGRAVAGEAGTSGGCAAGNPASCSYTEHMYGFPGHRYRLQHSASLSLPTTSAPYTGEGWSAYPSMCTAQTLKVVANAQVYSSVLHCAEAYYLRAA